MFIASDRLECGIAGLEGLHVGKLPRRLSWVRERHTSFAMSVRRGIGTGWDEFSGQGIISQEYERTLQLLIEPGG